jgi:hypothetical protein
MSFNPQKNSVKTGCDPTSPSSRNHLRPPPPCHHLAIVEISGQLFSLSLSLSLAKESFSLGKLGGKF